MNTTPTVRGNGSDLVLSESAKRYVRRSKAANTIRTYASALREFERFAETRGEPALPASVGLVVDYISTLADKGAKVSTIEVKLAAIAFSHRAAELPDPTVYEAVKVVMSGIRRELRRSPAKVEPATLDTIAAMVGTLDLETLKGKRDKALLLVGFAGAFRRSELVGLDVSDVSTNGRLKITVQQSKTDQTGQGLDKTIPEIGGDLCPVSALQDWLDAAGVVSGAVFRRMDRHGNVGERLTSQSVALVVKATAKDAGLDWRSFSGHSLRRGFITQAMDAGASDSDVQEQTGHQSLRVLRDYRKSTGVGASRAVLAAFGVE